MKAVKIYVNEMTYLEDLETPIGIYMKLRSMGSDAVLLESSDYESAAHSVSYVAVEPIGGFEVKDGYAEVSLPDGQRETREIGEQTVSDVFSEFMGCLDVSEEDKGKGVNGLFGYTAYEAVKYFEDVRLTARRRMEDDMAEMKYKLYRYVIALDHYRNEVKIIENTLEGQTSGIEQMKERIAHTPLTQGTFEAVGDETTDMTDEEYARMVTKGKESCKRGDVFQIVLSRRFSQGYRGDDINLYRKLRSINPSPYLFYFDYGSYHIFGSSPEVHLRVANGKAYIMPIAGTFRRTGNEERDAELAEKLRKDPKENAEHIMLVDLARNDLNRNAAHVKVEALKTVQFYSHVMHLVSSVSGEVSKDTNVMKLFAETFPAGTLSGSPKVKALELIDAYEGKSRGFYGGCIGMIGLDGSMNQAITIRSFLSRGNRLYYQAGAGVVARSLEESETQEVYNKLAALQAVISC